MISRLPQGGIYFFQLIDHYAASMSIMFLAFFEVIAISWLYGVRRLCNNVKEMTGRLPSMYFRFCWFLAAPLLIMVCNDINEFQNIKIFSYFIESTYLSKAQRMKIVGKPSAANQAIKHSERNYKWSITRVFIILRKK